MKSIFIEGGSSAYGMHDNENGGWAGRLHRESLAYDEANPTNPIVIINKSLPGLTLPAINRRFAEQAGASHRSFAAHQTRILAVGVNEAKILSGSKMPIINPIRFAAELAVFAEVSLSKGMAVIYIGPQPIDEARSEAQSENMGARITNDQLAEYAGAIKARADSDSRPFVDVHAAFAGHSLASVIASDGRHPNAAGHELIYRQVWPHLEHLFQA